jgi:amino-acid N-acetyltransferase
VGLLRSLAVEQPHRKHGIGRALVQHAESWAAQQGVEELYLLTTAAASFFAHLGYEALPRSQAPEAIARTTQFSEVCPGSASFMRRTIRA